MKKIILALVITVAFGLVISGQFDIYNAVKGNLGSVTNDGLYTYKNITTTNASTTSAVAVRGGSGVLGSIVVLKTSATALAVYDGSATTTGATLIGTIPASIIAGTYTFDTVVKSGIVLAGSAGFTGDYVITYR